MKSPALKGIFHSLSLSFFIPRMLYRVAGGLSQGTLCTRQGTPFLDGVLIYTLTHSPTPTQAIWKIQRDV